MMRADDSPRFVVRIEELRRHQPILPAGDDLGQRFHALLQDEELEVVFREFEAARGLSE
jgi:hypothetical protein